MKLSELSGAHIGKRVTITTSSATVTGALYSVNTEAQRITDYNFGGEITTAIGRIRVSVKVGAFEAKELDGLFDCEVHGE